MEPAIVPYTPLKDWKYTIVKHCTPHPQYVQMLSPCGITQPVLHPTATNTLQELVFSPGQLEREINITIIDDAIPEVDESFCVQLSLPEGGATLGRIPQSKMESSYLLMYCNNTAYRSI